MPVYPVVDSSMLREAAKRVKEIDPQIRKDLINGLKTDLKPYAAQIASGVPANPPLSGFAHNGRTRWSKITGSAYVTPGGGRGSLARIEIYGRGEARAGLKYADLAGTKNNFQDGKMSNRGRSPSYMVNGQGRALARNLQQRYPLSAGGKGGRFAWAGFMKHRPAFLDVVVKRLDEYSSKIERRFR